MFILEMCGVFVGGWVLFGVEWGFTVFFIGFATMW